MKNKNGIEVVQARRADRGVKLARDLNLLYQDDLPTAFIPPRPLTRDCFNKYTRMRKKVFESERAAERYIAWLAANSFFEATAFRTYRCDSGHVHITTKLAWEQQGETSKSVRLGQERFESEYT